MIRILQSVNIMDRAGLETMLMNYYKFIDHSVIQFDFLTHRHQEGAYDSSIETMGGKVYHAPRLNIQNSSTYFKYMKAFYKDHPEYKIIHSHIDAMSYFPLRAAKENDISIRIAHSHSSKLDRDLKFPIKYVALKNIPKVANEYCACSEVAGKFMFPEIKFKIVKNAIDLHKFAFDDYMRKKKRKELNLGEKYVIGHVGRYCYIKNQIFLLDIFKEILLQKKESHLLMVGKGEDQLKIENKIKYLGIEENVSLLVDRSDVSEIYQAMDVFVMPSLFEGLPVVGVEAQANGLPCIVSNKISREILLSNSIKMLSIDSTAKHWAKTILDMDICRNINAVNELSMAGYDIVTAAKKLQHWYMELSNYQR